MQLKVGWDIPTGTRNRGRGLQPHTKSLLKLGAEETWTASEGGTNCQQAASTVTTTKLKYMESQYCLGSHLEYFEELELIGGRQKTLL